MTNVAEVQDLVSKGTSNKPLKVLVHGERGIGITTFFAHAPDVLFLSLDGGTDRMDVTKWQGELATLSDLEVAIEQLASSRHDFRSIAVEGVEAIEGLIIDRIEERLQRDAEETDGPTTFDEYNDEARGGGWDLVRTEWRGLFQRLDALRARGMNILMSAPTQLVERRSVQDFPIHRFVPQIRGGQGVGNLLRGWFDHILYVADEEVLDVVDDVIVTCKRCKTTLAVVEGSSVDLFDKGITSCSHSWCIRRETKKTPTGKSVRFMHCTQTPWHDAKCHGGIEWPDRILFDVEHGWRRFSTNARLIREHGRALPTFLRQEGEKLIAQLGPRPDREVDYTLRQSRARSALEEAIAGRDYVRGQQIIDYVRGELEEDRKEAEK
jgi:hypothetical protein